MIETLNGAQADPEAARFQWHIGMTVELPSALPDGSNITRRPHCVPGDNARHFRTTQHSL